MNIGIVCREYPPAPGVGGIGTSTRDQARALLRLGHRVHVVAPAWDEPATQTDEGIVVDRIRVGRWRAPGVARVAGQTLDRLGWSWAAAREVANIHRREGLDVVEAPEFAAEGVVITVRGTAPVVVRLHTPLAVVRKLNGAPLTRDCRLTVRLERAALHRAAAVTAPSRAIAAACAEAGYGPRAAGARIIPHGIDTDLFSPGPAGPQSPFRGGGPLVVFAGRLEARKGLADLAEALPKIAARVPETVFAFVGADTRTAPGGGMWANLLWTRAREAGIGDRIYLPGFVPRGDLPDLYRAASVVVAPSPFECFGMVYLEAMACARPVIGCSAGAFPEIVTDGGEGVAVPPKDPAALADAVASLLEDPAEAAQMGERARRRAVDGFSLERVAATTADLYGEVAAMRRRQ